MAIYESGEDYLEAILMIRQEKGYVRSVDLANHLGYSKPSVSVAVKTLGAEGYLVMDEEDKHLSLTGKGEAVAQRIYERHRTLEAILVGLGVGRQQAEKDACRIEHDLSDESFERIKAAWLGSPLSQGQAAAGSGNS